MTVEESPETPDTPEPPAPPSTESIEGPKEQAEFSWTAPDPDPSPTVESPSAAPIGSLDALAYGAISGLHLSLAQLTGWEGWAFTSADEDAWRTLLRPMLAGLDPKKWGLAFALLGVAMLETGRIVGYMRWRKAHAPAPVPPAKRPATVRPPSVAPRETIEPAPAVETPLGRPLLWEGDGV